MTENELKWENDYMDMAVKELVKKIILDVYDISYNEDNFIITMAIMYGIFKNVNVY
ncbi:hypothetical protein [Clostridium beijerinckii]|uniref:hypothetical protein n=1 Tax=Clostridium beijerinckii TaxID=1520 RepID=UPI001FA8BD57|nr:hypothetical protein [Clostridium beijerinckii]